MKKSTRTTNGCHRKFNLNSTLLILISLALVFTSAGISTAEDKAAPAAEVKANAAAEPMKFWRSQRYGDWIMTCIALDNGDKEACTIKQELKTKEGANVLTIVIKKQEGMFLADFLLPHGIDISMGAWVVMETTKDFWKINLTTSYNDGFRGQLFLSKGFLDNMGKNSQGIIKLYPYDNKILKTKNKIQIPFSLKGAEEALSAIE